MALDFEKEALAVVENLEKELAVARTQLHKVRLMKRDLKDPTMRFYDVRPLDAIMRLLNENGGRMKKSELEELLEKHGLSVGKSSANNLQQSYRENLPPKGNKLVQDGEYIELPKAL